MRLNDLCPGEAAYIISLVQLDHADARKLSDLGLTPGIRITLVQRAPLGDPVWIEVRGYQLAFRSSLAAKIRVARDREGVSGKL